MTSDFLGVFLTYLPTYPNQMIYYISLFSKIRCNLTYLRTEKSDVICECSQKEDTIQGGTLFKKIQYAYLSHKSIYKLLTYLIIFQALLNPNVLDMTVSKSMLTSLIQILHGQTLVFGCKEQTPYIYGSGMVMY